MRNEIKAIILIVILGFLVIGYDFLVYASIMPTRFYSTTFDDLVTGNLNTQDGWSGSTVFQVNSVKPYRGAKSMETARNTSHLNIGNVGHSLQETGKMEMMIYINQASESYSDNVFILEVLNKLGSPATQKYHHCILAFKNSTNLYLSYFGAGPSYPTLAENLPVQEWVYFAVEWDNDENKQRCTYGEFTSEWFVPYSEGSGSPAETQLRFYVRALNTYVDDVGIVPQASDCTAKIKNFGFAYADCLTNSPDCDFMFKVSGYNYAKDYNSFIWNVYDVASSTYLYTPNRIAYLGGSYVAHYPLFFDQEFPKPDGISGVATGTYQFIYVMYDTVSESYGCEGAYDFVVDVETYVITRAMYDTILEKKAEQAALTQELQSMTWAEEAFTFVSDMLENGYNQVTSLFPFNWIFGVKEVWDEKRAENFSTSTDAFKVVWAVSTSTPHIGGMNVTVIDFEGVQTNYGSFLTLVRNVLLYVVWLVTIFVCFNKIRYYIDSISRET